MGSLRLRVRNGDRDIPVVIRDRLIIWLQITKRSPALQSNKNDIQSQKHFFRQDREEIYGAQSIHLLFFR